MSLGFKYAWGELVRVVYTAPLEFHPGRFCSVCGMRKQGDVNLYLVEFHGGDALEVEEVYLQPAEEDRADT